MKLKIDKHWLDKRSAQEDMLEVAAGSFPYELLNEPAVQIPDRDKVIPAFGRLINLCRRQSNMSIEELAAKAQVDVDKVLKIEIDVNYVPEPYIVHQLATILHLPEERMLELSGNIIPHDKQLSNRAVSFAARSEPLRKLTPEEQQALNEFVSYLSEG